MRLRLAKLPNLKLTQNEVSQTFDLKKILGVDVSDMPEVKQAIGQALVDHIITRTENGEDVSNKSFKGYSKEYINSLAFKAYDKSAGDVNLTLTGGMLGTLDIIEDSGNKIKIGWEDSTENAKAYNHNTGDTVKKREFFGITESEVKAISQEFKPDLKRSKNDDILLKKLDKIAGFILDFDDED
jgi:hypothetical protein